MDSDFIKRVAAKSVMAIATIDGYNSRIINTALDSIPAEDVRPVVHAQWISQPYAKYECSNCGFYEVPMPYDLCPKCGATMDRESPE